MIHVRPGYLGPPGNRRIGSRWRASCCIGRDPGFPGLMHWGAPSHEDSWYVRMRADPAVKSLVESFMRDLLPESRDYFDGELAPERLAPDLTPAFLEAAKSRPMRSLARGSMRELSREIALAGLSM